MYIYIYVYVYIYIYIYIYICNILIMKRIFFRSLHNSTINLCPKLGSWVILFSITSTCLFISNTIKPQDKISSNHMIGTNLENKVDKQVLFEGFLVL